MSFREKTHWVAFIAIALAFGWYFLSYPWALSHSNAGMGAAGGMLVVVTLAIILMMSIVVGVIAARAPSDASLKADEREQHIHQFGTHLAYYPLVLGDWVEPVAGAAPNPALGRARASRCWGNRACACHWRHDDAASESRAPGQSAAHL